MKLSQTEENYLKSIYQLQKNGNVTTNELADKLNARPASVTDMMKKLSTKGLLHYKKYYGFSLTAEGKKLALNIIRRHRLWEFFLAEKLGFLWNEVHPLAEQLEHVSSLKLTDRLDEYLGFPPFDPHGDPIPDSKGKIRSIDKIPLNEVPVNKTAEIIQVANQSQEILELVQHKGIELGTRLQVKRKFNFDGSLEVRMKNQTFFISEQVAKNLFVKKL